MSNEKFKIETYTGMFIDPLNCKMEDIEIEDIAQALSLKCRFGGHCDGFYSVAQHSVLVSENCTNKFGGLMHDAAEAYISDIPTPVKIQLKGIEKIEDNLLRIIFEKYNLYYPLSNDIKETDKRMCLTEAYNLGLNISNWKLREIYELYDFDIEKWSWEKSKKEFLKRFYELYYKETK